MIYTSYFDCFGKLHTADSNLVFVSIAGKTPNHFNDNEILKYPKLAPKRDWWDIWFMRYHENLESQDSRKFYIEKYYETVLNKLEPHKVKSELLELSNGQNVVLMCFETPDKFCHRHIVSDWFRKNGIECGEYICPVLIDKLFKLKD
jgi:uncharacterized protein (DUF488 family)